MEWPWLELCWTSSVCISRDRSDDGEDIHLIVPVEVMILEGLLSFRMLQTEAHGRTYRRVGPMIHHAVSHRVADVDWHNLVGRNKYGYWEALPFWSNLLPTIYRRP